MIRDMSHITDPPAPFPATKDGFLRATDAVADEIVDWTSAALFGDAPRHGATRQKPAEVRFSVAAAFEYVVNRNCLEVSDEDLELWQDSEPGRLVEFVELHGAVAGVLHSYAGYSEADVALHAKRDTTHVEQIRLLARLYDAHIQLDRYRLISLGHLALVSQLSAGSVRNLCSGPEAEFQTERRGKEAFVSSAQARRWLQGRQQYRAPVWLDPHEWLKRVSDGGPVPEFIVRRFARRTRRPS